MQSKKAIKISSRVLVNPTLHHDSESLVLSKPTKAVEVCREVEHLLADASTSSIFPMGGVAARLMEYGQKYNDDYRYIIMIFCSETLHAETMLVRETILTFSLWGIPPVILKAYTLFLKMARNNPKWQKTVFKRIVMHP